MVKHAARDEEPLLTAEERVGRAFDRLTAKDTFTPETATVAGSLRQHLIANPSIDQDDFENVPILPFRRPCGYVAVTDQNTD